MDQTSAQAYGPRPFPKWLLYGAGLMIAVTLALATWSRLTGLGDVPPPQSEQVAQRSLHFADLSDGSVQVMDARSEEVIAVLEPGTNGFIRSLMRGLARERHKRGISAATPFQLKLWEDGRLTLVDPTTGQSIFLNAFGADNVGAFARLLDPKASTITGTHSQ